jgi:hypothetical protein
MSIVDKILLEANMDTVEKLFPEGDVNRYAFIWRDCTKFDTIEKKRAIVDKMEKLRKSNGRGLPTVKLDPMLFASNRTGAEEAKESPVVCKLHGVYYAIDGYVQPYKAYFRKEEWIPVKLFDLDSPEVVV